ncbi:MAG: PTS sugar transporter subunit IIB [Treponema sp.]|jgi:PTS system mannose-specific IIB component|nr:PTS sugar transporter subunit IIB [Treponema sp.]
MIVFLRIDERMIHGQIAIAWSKALAVTHIVVANDDVSNDAIQKSALLMATPADVKTIIKSVDEAIGILNDPRLKDKRVMAIVKRPDDALRIVQAVPGIPSVNVGNTGFLGDTTGVKEFVKFIRLSEKDIACLKEIQAIVPVELQVIPDSIKKSFNSAIGGGN